MRIVKCTFSNHCLKSYLGAGEEQPHPLHADLQQPALARLAVLRTAVLLTVLSNTLSK